MSLRTLPSSQGEHHLKNYEEEVKHFEWASVEKNFSWSTTGQINIAYECIDRHCETSKKNQIALLYSDDERDEQYTFQELKNMSNRAGNVLKKHGVEKGDRVFVFMPRSPELYVALLGAMKLGAIAGCLFEAFMEKAVRDRLEDSGAKVLITTTKLLERVPVDELPKLEKVFVIGSHEKKDDRYLDFMEEMNEAHTELDITWVERDDSYFLHYTSRSTGKPKGILHTHQAMIQQYQTARWVLDLKDDDIYWCTADPGWATGISYGMIAPWLCGVTNVVRGGRFHPDDWYATLEKHRVTVWYSAPTAFRMLMSAGDELVARYQLSSLRHILSAGEPLNEEVIHWAMELFKLRIHDNWWMTETGAQMISNYPSMEIRPGSMGKPIPGVTAAILDENGKELPPNEVGTLALKVGWPSMMKAIWNSEGDDERYFAFPGWFLTSDSAYIDEDGYFWFQKRGDDLIMSGSERVNPFEVESKLLEHPAVAEAGVVGKPDSIRGEVVKAFISLREPYEASAELNEEIRQFVKEGLGAHAAPRILEFHDKLPKTRSGKLMRRVLKTW